MAVLDKPSIYYQFDEASFFNGGHVYTKGYFDYRQHGFGPVVTDQQTLLFELEKMLKNDESDLARKYYQNCSYLPTSRWK